MANWNEDRSSRYGNDDNAQRANQNSTRGDNYGNENRNRNFSNTEDDSDFESGSFRNRSNMNRNSSQDDYGSNDSQGYGSNNSRMNRSGRDNERNYGNSNDDGSNRSGNYGSPSNSYGSSYRSSGGPYGRGSGGSSANQNSGNDGNQNYGGGYAGSGVGPGGYGATQYPRGSQGGYGNRTSGYGTNETDLGNERGWWDRTTDEVSSWFGDEDASRRRNMDQARGKSGQGPRGYARSDSRVSDDVNDRLTDDPHIDASNIDVTVEDGEVTLTGTVENRFEKRHAEDIIENLSGVKHVQNNLRVSDIGKNGSLSSNAGSTGQANNTNTKASPASASRKLA